MGRQDVLSSRSKAEERGARRLWGEVRGEGTLLQEMRISAVSVHSLGKERGENEEKL